VYLEVDAQPALLGLVRGAAAYLAARADFDLDAVSDLQMVVEEACSTLAAVTPPGARLRCLLQVDPDQITVTVLVSATGAAMIRRDTFGWRVLNTLADEVEVLSEDLAGGSLSGIRLIKARRTGVA
jgi:serine/threonine-protein kinase RsbW